MQSSSFVYEESLIYYVQENMLFVPASRQHKGAIYHTVLNNIKVYR